VIKCLDAALSKLRIDERKMRQLAVAGKFTLPEMKPVVEGEKDGRLKKLREVLVISLERILDQVGSLAAVALQVTSQDEVDIIRQTLDELQSLLNFSRKESETTKIEAQDIVDGLRFKIENLKMMWKDLPLEKQVENAKIIVGVKKEMEDFCASLRLALPLFEVQQLGSVAQEGTQLERITKTIFLTLDKIHSMCLAILKADTQPNEQLVEKLLDVYKSLSIK